MDVKGAVVKSIKQYVLTNHEQDYDKWLASLSPESHEIFSKSINVTQFFDVDAGLVEPCQKVSDMFFANVEAASRELGNYSAGVALTGIYKVFILIATPTFVISRSASMMRTLYANSELVVTDKSSNSVTAEIRALPKHHIVLEERIAGWMEKILEMTGCTNVKIDIPLRLSKNDKITKYHITWN